MSYLETADLRPSERELVNQLQPSDMIDDHPLAFYRSEYLYIIGDGGIILGAAYGSSKYEALSRLASNKLLEPFKVYVPENGATDTNGNLILFFIDSFYDVSTLDIVKLPKPAFSTIKLMQE